MRARAGERCEPARGTGFPAVVEAALASICVAIAPMTFFSSAKALYGTRTHTVVAIDWSGRGTLIESDIAADTLKWSTNSLRFGFRGLV